MKSLYRVTLIDRLHHYETIILNMTNRDRRDVFVTEDQLAAMPKTYDADVARVALASDVSGDAVIMFLAEDKKRRQYFLVEAETP